MNILIVDDEVYVADGIKTSINWKKLGIKNSFVAYNMKQAKNIFKKHDIDILLCDIEMPKGSGLDLLSWVREANYNTIAIFLTSHANFDYASKALRLDSLDYILKPVSYEKLEKVIKSAQEKVKSQKSKQQQKLMSDYWNDSKNRLREQFWLNIFENTFAESNQIHIEGKKLYPDTDILTLEYCPILMQLMPNENQVEPWDINLVEYALKNILDETLFENKSISSISRMGNDLYLIIIGTKNRKNNLDVLIKHLKEVITSCSKIIPYFITCYIHEYMSINKLSDSYNVLINTWKNKIPIENTVYIAKEHILANTEYNIKELNDWVDNIFTGNSKDTLDKMFIFLEQYKDKKITERKFLRRLHHDFLQGIYTYLKEKNIQAHLLFQDDKSISLTQNSVRSFEDMKKWLSHTTDKALSFYDDIDKSNSLIDTIKKYIEENIDSDLNRNDIAERVYLTPDYISHYFKEKTGNSLSEYILNRRISKAKKLLYNTNLPIKEISLKVGYPSISYFSKIFKRQTGKTPSEYRR